MNYSIQRFLGQLGVITCISLGATSLWAQVLNAPKKLTKRITAIGNVHLGWIDNNTATDKRFSVERRQGTSGTFQEIATIAPEQRIHVDKTVQAGTTYQYRVRTFRSNIYSGYSNTVQVKLPGTAAPTPTPTTPTPTPEPAPTAGVLMYSYEANLANGRALSGATLDRKTVYFYISNPSLYRSVNFYCCKGFGGAANGEGHLAAVLDQTAPFSHSVDLAQFNGGTRELYVDAMKVGTSTYDNISTMFTLKDGVTTTPPPVVTTPPPVVTPPPSSSSLMTGATAATRRFTRFLNFDSGSIGSKAEGSGGFDGAAGNSYYSRAQAFSGAQSCEMNATGGQTGFGNWGGIIAFPQDLRRGDEVLISLKIYFPQGFDYNSYGEGNRLKFLRIHTRSASVSNFGYVDWYINGRGSGNPFSYIYEGEQVWSDFGSSADAIEFDKWETYQYYVRFDNVPMSRGGMARIRVFKNGKQLKDIQDRTTLATSDAYAESFFLFTYWNGAAPKSQKLYVDDVLVTSQ